MQWAPSLQNMFASSSSQLGKRLNAWLSSTLLYIISIIYTAAALINFFGCVWYWVARREGLPNSWLTQVGECPCDPFLWGECCLVDLQWLHVPRERPLHQDAST